MAAELLHGALLLAVEGVAVPICGSDQKLKGMLTDRDIVVEALAARKAPASCTAGGGRDRRSCAR
ncbi:hypothetical protein [Streptomyces subrutilus]|uniref:hypothetical protein n=1 Tax=Streptomyces subrutilus TaxID=36818 RepID=UPI0033E7177B